MHVKQQCNCNCVSHVKKSSNVNKFSENCKHHTDEEPQLRVYGTMDSRCPPQQQHLRSFHRIENGRTVKGDASARGNQTFSHQSVDCGDCAAVSVAPVSLDGVVTSCCGSCCCRALSSSLTSEVTWKDSVCAEAMADRREELQFTVRSSVVLRIPAVI